MEEAKYYRFGTRFYKIGQIKGFERISMYHHNFGIEYCAYFVPSMSELEEITEAQYMRVKKLILAKLCV